MAASICEHVEAENAPLTTSGGNALPASEYGWSRVDPLDEDTHSDAVIQTTDRALVRLAVAATETGARFEREGLEFDAAAWMMAPRDIFDGRAAIEACMERQGFQRNLLLHGLQLGLDADPQAVDALLEDDAGGQTSGDLANNDGNRPHPNELSARVDLMAWSDPQLRTCWLDTQRGGVRIFAFFAVVSERPEDIVDRVIGRFGKSAAQVADFRVGYDHSTPLGVAMISDALADTLALCSSDPRSPLAEGLDVLVEQRFKA